MKRYNFTVREKEPGKKTKWQHIETEEYDTREEAMKRFKEAVALSLNNANSIEIVVTDTVCDVDIAEFSIIQDVEFSHM